MTERKPSIGIKADLGKIMEGIEKKYGESLFIGNLPEFEFVKFSSPTLNYLTEGGVPMGASIEIVGEEHSGKSTLVLDLIKNYQEYEKNRVDAEYARLTEEHDKAKTKKQKETILEERDALQERYAVYLDLEHTLNPQWIKKLGIDETKVIIYKSKEVAMEGPLDNILEMMETDQVGFVALDSIGVMISGIEEASELGKGNYGGPSKSLTKYYKKAIPLYSTKNIMHVVVNQTREDMGGYGRLIRPGGKANAFAQSVVLRLRPGQGLDEKLAPTSNNSTEIYAKTTTTQSVKNKAVGLRRQLGTFTIKPGYGIYTSYDTVQLAKQFGMISTSGSWYTIFDPKTGEETYKAQGEYRIVDYLEENPEFMQSMIDTLYELSLPEEEDN